ncbi:DUF433 domain-containing protein [Puia sp.]|uniref:DUF433 domain-containing protein n=1 Tax=Puia sp. TaxID=2045100 RepID=UPI0039C9088B
MLSGELCIYDTSVPVSRLFEHLTNGKSVASFLRDSPAVDKDIVLQLLKRAESLLLDSLTNSLQKPIA